MFCPGFAKVMRSAMVSFAWKFLHLSRSGVKIVPTGFAQATHETQWCIKFKYEPSFVLRKLK